MDYSLPWDTIDSVTFIPYHDQKKVNIPLLVKKSTKRLKKNKLFQSRIKMIDRIKKEKKITMIDTSIALLYKNQTQIDALNEEYENLNHIADYYVWPTENRRLNADNGYQARQRELFDFVVKDIYLSESFSILHDLVQLYR